MKYHGKLYGKIGNKYFDTGKTSKDFDEMFEFISSLENDNNSIPEWLWQKRNELLTKITE